jgi:steroid delta-isomerase-like uncharacterized protein
MTTGTDLAQRIADAFNAGDVDAFAACFAPGAVQIHPFFPEPLRGREAIRAAEGAMFAAFEAISMDVLSVVDSGSRVAMELAVRATNTKPLAMPDGATLPPTGRSVDLTMSAFLTLDEDGQIVEAHRYQDNLAFMRQLGLA